MNIDIRSNIINNLKDNSSKEIIQTINSSVSSNDELSLPGLGVLLELVWNNYDDNEKSKFSNLLIKKMNQ